MDLTDDAAQAGDGGLASIGTRERRDHRESAGFAAYVEPAREGSAACDASELSVLPVGDGLALDVVTLDGVPLPTLQPDAAEAHTLLCLEPLDDGRNGALMLVVPAGVDIRVNALPAPRVSLLDVGDQLQLGEQVLHVTRARDGTPRRPRREELGRRCPVCAVEIVSTTHVVRHVCSAVLHAEQPGDAPETDRLECSSLGCPECDRPVEIGAGYVFTPEL